MALALNCGIPSTPQGRELVQHGSALFPIACYEERLTCYSVPWHWHEDFEYILAYEGTVTVGVAAALLMTMGVGAAVTLTPAGEAELQQFIQNYNELSQAVGNLLSALKGDADHE